MFDHLQEKRPPAVHRTTLLAAIALALGSFGGLAALCLFLLSLLGFGNVLDPVEVSYDPYEDGRTLEDILGEGEVPIGLRDSVAEQR